MREKSAGNILPKIVSFDYFFQFAYFSVPIRRNKKKTSLKFLSSQKQKKMMANFGVENPIYYGIIT